MRAGRHKRDANTPLLRGNGCPRHPDCFTCPLPDCTWASHDESNVRRGARTIVRYNVREEVKR